ncbi:MAG: type IV pilus modification protein PilV [Woeseiaceae bacterium]
MLLAHTKRDHRNRAPQKLRGFSLVEVLIALVIMSVGMLGIAGLYVQSMQAGRTSMLRHHAVTLAGDVADRIRANPRAGIAYEGPPLNGNCVSGVVSCDEVGMAGHDIMLWQEQAVDTLPTGTVTIVFDDSGVPPIYTITVGWDEPGAVTPPSYEIVVPVMPN